MKLRVGMQASIAAIVVLAAACSSMAYYEGNSRLAQGDYAGAVTELTEAIRLDPQNFGAVLNRGVAYEKLQQLDQALQDYDLALRIVPSFGMAYQYRGHIHSARHEYELAIEDYDLTFPGFFGHLSKRGKREDVRHGKTRETEVHT